MLLNILIIIAILTLLPAALLILLLWEPLKLVLSALYLLILGLVSALFVMKWYNSSSVEAKISVDHFLQTVFGAGIVSQEFSIF